MKINNLLGAFLATASLLAANPSHATLLYFTADLSGANEVPANASPGTGVAKFELDTEAHTLRLQVSFSGLIGTTTAAHIHCCTAAPANVGVATTVPTFAGFPQGVTSGVYDIVLDLTAASSFNPDFITAHGGIAGAESVLTSGIIAGESYLNIHTTEFRGGEIRGTLFIPEPGMIGMLGLGLGLTGLLVRRRSQRA